MSLVVGTYGLVQEKGRTPGRGGGGLGAEYEGWRMKTLRK